MTFKNKILNEKDEISLVKPNVVFVNMPSIALYPLIEDYSQKSFNELETQSLYMPLGILYISSYLKTNNKCIGNIGIIDYAANFRNIKLSNYRDMHDFINSISIKSNNFTPDIIAFSLMFSTQYDFLNIAIQEIKSIWPKAITIVGGFHATNDTKNLLNNKNVDYVCRGEGEIAFLKFVKHYSLSSHSIINIKGIYCKEDIKANTKLEICDFVDDLDEFVFPDWNLINIQMYMDEKHLTTYVDDTKKRKIVAMLTTRGCPFRCTFCSNHTVHGGKVRWRTTKNILDEIKLLNKLYDANTFVVLDDSFTFNKERVIKLLSEIKKLNIQDIELQFPNGLSVNTLDEDIIDKLIDVGLKVAILAIESGSEYVQREIIKKNCNLQKAKQLVKYFNKKRILVKCFFILGFPNETKELMYDTIRYAKELSADWNYFFIATPLVGSEMYDQFVDMGYISSSDTSSFSKTFYKERFFDTKEISAEELRKFCYRANLECNFICNPNKTNGKFETALKLYEDVTSKYPFHIVAWYCIMELYLQMGQLEKSKQISKKIYTLIKSDINSKEMFEKYNDLMPLLDLKNRITI